MKYVCLAWREEAVVDALSREQRAALQRQTLDYIEALRESGHLLGAERLQGPENGVALRRLGGSLSVTDGPFAETKEQIGGMFLLEAADLNEAIQLASRWPPLALSTLEIRPVAGD